MNKKILKWLGGAVIVIIALLFITPLMFKGKIQDLVLKTINEQVNATVDFKKVNLSLVRNFPKATISIEDLTVINKEPFLGDTLVASKELRLTMSIKELFKSADEAMAIESFTIQNADVAIKVNKDGVANYDIVIEQDEKDKDKEESDPFALALDYYEIKALNLSYLDESAKMSLAITDLNHRGKGNLTANILDLDTESEAKVSFTMDNTRYLNAVSLNLKAIIGMDMDNQIYTFKENKALINQLPLTFDGSIQLLDNGQKYNLTFATPDSDFKNFLGLIPEVYAGNLKGVTTTGDFKVEGNVKGTLSDTTIPTFGIHMASNNASFKYADLAMAVENIMLDIKVNNTTGILKDTYVNLDDLAFKIGSDSFKAKATIQQITENPLVDASLNGVINLGNLTKAYPIQLDKPLSGILTANMQTQFDMLAVKNNNYQKIKNAGNISLRSFSFETQEMPNPLNIAEASLAFNTNFVSLNKLAIKTGSTDIAATGRLDNLYGFLFNKQVLKGNFNLHSTNFVLADLLKENTSAEKEKEVKEANTTPGPSFKIPGFLDCTITADAKKVVYDNLVLDNVKGTLIIKDETARLQNMSTNIFNGSLGFDGIVSTKNDKTNFDMDLNLQKLDIVQTFTQLDFLKAIAPIGGVISGKINGGIKLKGNLDDATFSPIMQSLSGDIVGDLFDTNLDPQKSKLLSALDQNVKFINLDRLNLNNKKIHLVFKDGNVQFKPFDLKLSEGMSVTVSGEHGLDQTMNYDLDFKVPAKLLGNDIANVLTKLTSQEASKFGEIPVKAKLTGSFSQPKIGTNMGEVVTNLTNQIVEEQKNQLVNKGKSALLDLIGDKKKDTPVDGEKTTDEKKKEEVVNKIGEGLKGLFGKKKKEEPTE